MGLSTDTKRLLDVLTDSRIRTIASKDADWASMDVPEMVAILDQAIRQLRDSIPVDTAELRFLFAATGPLQETSMSNGWSDEFLKLAYRVDQILGDTS